MNKMPILFLVALSFLSAKDYVVNQKGKTFLPTKISAKVGDRLVFKNSDSFSHNAYTDDEENEFDIGMQSPGQDIAVELKAPATIAVECAIHPNMLLTVEVK